MWRSQRCEVPLELGQKLFVISMNLLTFLEQLPVDGSDNSPGRRTRRVEVKLERNKKDSLPGDAP